MLDSCLTRSLYDRAHRIATHICKTSQRNRNSGSQTPRCWTRSVVLRKAVHAIRAKSHPAPSTRFAALSPFTCGPTLEVIEERAFRDKAFVCLVAGFSTCGFHMVIIESHLFSQYVSYGIGAAEASWGFSLYGIATILGALLSGWLSARVSKGALLAFYYGFRAVWAIAFMLFMPKTLLGAVIFSVGLGLTGDATVSPTAGVVNGRFSVTESATLIGLLFFCHQIGAFSSAWFGGLLFGATGSYGAIWAIDVGLCTFAAVASSRIRKNVQRKP